MRILLASLLTACMFVGCGGDEDTENQKIPVNFLSAYPPSGSETPSLIKLTFDGIPEDVETSAGTAVITGKTVTIHGPFTPGPLSVTVTWSDGSITLSYTV